MMLPVEEGRKERAGGSAELFTVVWPGLADGTSVSIPACAPLCPPSTLLSAHLRQLLCAVELDPQSSYQS